MEPLGRSSELASYTVTSKWLTPSQLSIPSDQGEAPVFLNAGVRTIGVRTIGQPAQLSRSEGDGRVTSSRAVSRPSLMFHSCILERQNPSFLPSCLLPSFFPPFWLICQNLIAVAQTDLELLTLLPQFPEYRNYRFLPPAHLQL